MSDLEKRVDIGIPDNILQAGRLLTDYFKENKVTCFMGLASRDEYEELSKREKKLVSVLEDVDELWGGDDGFKEEKKGCSNLKWESPVLKVWTKIRTTLRELGIEEGVC